MTLSNFTPKFTDIRSSVGAIGLALVWTGLTFGAALSPAPVEARTTAPHYVAELAAPTTEARKIINGVMWSCEGTTCKARNDGSRPKIVCARVSRELGEVAQFTTKGKALAADKLASCNGK